MEALENSEELIGISGIEAHSIIADERRTASPLAECNPTSIIAGFLNRIRGD
jgi:hypothetical protein